MNPSKQGSPCWYELSTSDADAAARFYGEVLGWQVEDAGMPGFDYRQAKIDRHAVAGMTALPQADDPDAPAAPGWLIYFVVDDADASAVAVRNTGGRLGAGPQDIPGVGRFAMLSDPQGAAFGVLQPAPMAQAQAAMAPAFDPQRQGHGQWHELMSSSPKLAFEFYGALFGWSRSMALDMGPGMGTYQVFAHDGLDIGGMMGLGMAPKPSWLPYFGVDAASAAMQRIEAAGGEVLHGPVEVPGPAWIAIARDPQGAQFAVVGPAK